MVDTAVLFPHRLGLPYKRSLRNLMADYLRQIIQDNGEGGRAARGRCCGRGGAGWGRAHPDLCPLHSGRAQLQRGRQRLHAPGDLEDPRRRQDQAVTAARPPAPRLSRCPGPSSSPGLFQNSAINLES